MNRGRPDCTMLICAPWRWRSMAARIAIVAAYPDGFARRRWRRARLPLSPAGAAQKLLGPACAPRIPRRCWAASSLVSLILDGFSWSFTSPKRFAGRRPATRHSAHGCFDTSKSCSRAAALRDRSARSGGCLPDCPGGTALLCRIREALSFAADRESVTCSPGSRRDRGGRRPGGGLAVV